ncbi:D-cysteine desulfhydrase family protein [Kibdelosporangium persicum]|uniref:Cytochrome C biogenesis protein CcmE n=1 Tax=Kibdelosporangium persicum TaxID=2698649 RepID=A0ABX2F8E3_9PSEU|nr:D-cysteine desulfhydrase family protein [Kibdelosporangium persicum]NRN67616.1 Cytochrome C biogenesis protein CcmE [Kibdelosporangium persicum]
MPIDLSGQPRVGLGHWPTPLEDCPRLTEALGGPRILVKRDDVNGLGVGGNKLRKAEFLLGKALAEGADTVITFGAVQTNHGRQIAAACARLGLRCELVLTRSVPMSGEAYERSGNIALDGLYGAHVHVCDTPEQAGEVYDKVVAAARADGRKTATFPVGGSNGVGVLGYVAAVDELHTQLDGTKVNRIVVAVGSAGTAAGLAVGIALLDWPVVLDGQCISHTAGESLADIRRLAGEVSDVLGTPVGDLAHVQVGDGAVGPGYGVPTAEMWEALRLFARTEGITLDPVYSGKAAAAVVAGVRSGAIGADETVVFLHTGGLPGLFAYAPELVRSSENQP